MAASVDDLLFDDEIRIVSEEGDEVEEGRGIGSPVPEDLEEFPEDYEELPEDQVVPSPAEKPKAEEKGERIVPIVLESHEDQPKQEAKKARGKGDEESSPLPLRKKAKADLLEDFKEVQTTVEEQQQQKQTVEESSTFTQASSTKTVVQSSTVFESSSSTVVETSSTAVGAQIKQVEVIQAESQAETLTSGQCIEATTAAVESATKTVSVPITQEKGQAEVSE